jgi:CHASE2 domain-containing sensor protein
MRRAILNLGNGTLQQGCDTVVLELIEVNKRYPIQRVASLPPAPNLEVLYQQWQHLYLTRNQNQLFRIHLSRTSGLRYSEAEFQSLCQTLSEQLNAWLNAPAFRVIDQELRMAFNREEAFQIIVATHDQYLHRLPWHLWQFFEDYPKAEVALSRLDWQELATRPASTGTCKILVLLGDTRGIDVDADCKILRELPGTEMTVLQNSNHREFNEFLWNPRGWDILFFAGHSQTEGQAGRIQLNETESLTIPQLKHALGKAIANGLKLAMFNSCDGIGLAHQLADLHIPYTIVMREPVPDPVAQKFLQFFFAAFSGGMSFHLAVREARQKLETLESEIPCASWLPVIWQNPTAAPFLCPTGSSPTDQTDSPRRQSPRLSWQRVVTVGLMMTGLVMGARSLGWLESIELAAYDQLMRQRPPEPIDPRILVIEVTQEDTNRYGYPLPDATLVKLIQQLERAQARAIGLDMHRPQPRGKGKPTLHQQFAASSQLFMVCAYSSKDKSYAPPPVSSPAKLRNQVGFSDLLVDSAAGRDRGLRTDLAVGEQSSPESLTVRRQLLSYDPSVLQISSNCATPYSLSFQLAFQFLDAAKIAPLDVNANQEWQFGPVAFRDLTPRFGGYQHLDGGGSQVLVNYRANQPGRRASLSQVLNGQVEPRVIQDRVVLIGYTAPVARDFFDTPYGTMPGVWIHAHMLSQMLSAVLDRRPLIWTLPQERSIQWGDLLWVLSWATVGGLLTGKLASKSPLYLALAITLSVWVLYQLCLVILTQGGWLPLIPSMVSLLSTSALVTLHKVARIRKDETSA